MNTTERDAASTERIERLLDEREAARFMGLMPNTLAMWRATRRYPLRYIVLGGLIRYRLSDIEKFLLDRTVDEDGKTPKGIKRRPPGPGRPPEERSRRVVPRQRKGRAA